MLETKVNLIKQYSETINVKGQYVIVEKKFKLIFVIFIVILR